MLYCDKCLEKKCCTMEEGSMTCCPTLNQEVQAKAEACYSEEETHRMAYASAMTETVNAGRNTRVEEIMVFAKYAGYQKIGIAFCMSLREEAEIFGEILRDNGFSTHAIICKNGGFSKDILNSEYLSQRSIRSKFAMCNPVGQAMMLNLEDVDLVVILGLCVGHDTMVMKYCEKPMTYLAVKDRWTGHNPLSPLYQHKTLFSHVHHVEIPEEK